MILASCVLFSFLTVNIMRVVDREYSFEVKPTRAKIEDLLKEEVSMVKYWDSLNFGFGFDLQQKYKDEGFDMLDNDYVELGGWRLTGYPKVFTRDPNY